MDSFFRMPQIQKEALSDINTVQVCPISVFPRPVCVGFEWKALCRLQDAKNAELNSGFILLACPGNHGTHWTQLRPAPGGLCFKELFASRLKWMLVVLSVMEVGPGCSRFHAVGSPNCRGRMLSRPLYRAVEASTVRRRPRVVLSKALCCPASNNQWYPSSVSSLTCVLAHKSQYSASASWELLHCAQISNHRHPSASVLPQPSSSNTPYASGIRSQTLLRPDLHGILDLVALQPLPDHGCVLFLHPSSPHQRPCLLARSECEPRSPLFDPSQSTSCLDCWLVI